MVLKGNLNSFIEPGFFKGEYTDRIWLDRDHGLVPRKREMALDGRVHNRWITADLKQVEPGIWLPMTIRRESFTARPHPDLKDRPVMLEEIHVQSLTVNKVPDNRFDMLPQNGDAIIDLRGRF